MRHHTVSPADRPARPLIAFFDFPDVFEDFYPHYKVTQRAFATQWAATGNHAYLAVVQRVIGDVVWCAFSRRPELVEERHAVVGCRVRFYRVPWFHRALWWLFYMPRPAWRWRRHYFAYAALASYLALLSLRFLADLWRGRPDVLFVQDYATGRFDVLVLLGRLLGIPVLAVHSGSQPERYIAKGLKPVTIRRAARLIVSSRAEGEMLIARFGARPDRVVLILTPIDMTAFHLMDRGSACRAVALAPERRYVLFVGRLDDPIKRVSALIRCFAALADRFPTFDLAIAGGGPDEAMLVAIARDLAPNRVKFLGWVADKPALAALYNAAALLALPSRSEGFPTVIGEAMACGTPVLGSRVGGIGELVIEGETGFLVEPGNDESLTTGLARALASPARLADMRAAARRVAVERVSPEAVGRALAAAFREAALDHGRR